MKKEKTQTVIDDIDAFIKTNKREGHKRFSMEAGAVRDKVFVKIVCAKKTGTGKRAKLFKLSKQEATALVPAITELVHKHGAPKR